MVDTSCTKFIAKEDSPVVKYRTQKLINTDDAPCQIDTRTKHQKNRTQTRLVPKRKQSQQSCTYKFKRSALKIDQTPNNMDTILFDGNALPGLAEVLIIDDCPFQTFTVEQVLYQLGFKVEICTDGLAAIRAMESRLENNEPYYKLILIDLTMPAFDGIQTIKQILELVSDKGIDPNNVFTCCTTAYLHIEKQ